MTDDDGRPRRRGPRRGYTLIEVMVVLTIMGVLLAAPAARFGRAMEQPKLDLATGNLRAIWAAERFYFLETGRFGALADLAADPLAADLLDPTILDGSAFFAYAVAPSGDGQTFLATATRPPSPQVVGSLTIDQAGNLACGVTYMGRAMTPSMEPGP